MQVVEEHALGRVLILHWNGVLDGTGLSPEQVRVDLVQCGARLLLLDTTRAPYADSEGVRWLLRLQNHLEACGKRLRIVARPQGKVWRVLSLLQLGLEMFESVGRAWKAPWHGHPWADFHGTQRQKAGRKRSRLRRRRERGSSV